VWFLNAFWEEGMNEEAEHMWRWVDKIKSFDIQKGAEGSELDELNAHRFLEVRKIIILPPSYLRILMLMLTLYSFIIITALQGDDDRD